MRNHNPPGRSAPPVAGAPAPAAPRRWAGKQAGGMEAGGKQAAGKPIGEPGRRLLGKHYANKYGVKRDHRS